MIETKKLIIATGNKNKLTEFQSILSNYNVVSIPVETKEIQGTSYEVIIEKAKQCYKILNKECIVEDTSFGFVEWNGFPGPYIKDFIKVVGLEKLSTVTENKNAFVTCLIALVNSPEDIIVFEGKVFGQVKTISLKEGFEFDRVFVPDGYNICYAEMPLEKKNQISHRFLAISKLKEYLDSKNNF